MSIKKIARKVAVKYLASQWRTRVPKDWGNDQLINYWSSGPQAATPENLELIKKDQEQNERMRKIRLEEFQKDPARVQEIVSMLERVFKEREKRVPRIESSIFYIAQRDYQSSRDKEEDRNLRSELEHLRRSFEILEACILKYKNQEPLTTRELRDLVYALGKDSREAELVLEWELVREAREQALEEDYQRTQVILKEEQIRMEREIARNSKDPRIGILVKVLDSSSDAKMQQVFQQAIETLNRGLELDEDTKKAIRHNLYRHRMRSEADLFR